MILLIIYYVLRICVHFKGIVLKNVAKGLMVREQKMIPDQADIELNRFEFLIEKGLIINAELLLEVGKSLGKVAEGSTAGSKIKWERWVNRLGFLNINLNASCEMLLFYHMGFDRLNSMLPELSHKIRLS